MIETMAEFTYRGRNSTFLELFLLINFNEIGKSETETKGLPIARRS